MHQFPDYPCRLKTNPDSRWVVYLSQLYPSVELLGIRDRDVCSQLQQHDDPLTVPRQLIHHACFVTEAGRDRFVSGVVDLGYTIESATERGDSAMPFGIEFRRVDVPGPWQITDRVTATLFHLAADAGGAYDGWGSPVVRSDR
jgi:hypothetical protein